MNNAEDELVILKIARKDFFIVTNDHGGYLEGYCFSCKKHGWEDRIQHTPECPVVLPSTEKVTEIPELIKEARKYHISKDLACVTEHLIHAMADRIMETEAVLEHVLNKRTDFITLSDACCYLEEELTKIRAKHRKRANTVKDKS